MGGMKLIQYFKLVFGSKRKNGEVECAKLFKPLNLHPPTQYLSYGPDSLPQLWLSAVQ